MQYEIEVIHRNSPSHRFTLTITVETDMKRYLNSYQCLFDDYGISKFLDKLHDDFMVITSECPDIKDLEKAHQEITFAGESCS